MSQGDQLAHGEYMVQSLNNCLEAIIKDLSHSTIMPGPVAVTPPMHQSNMSWIPDAYPPPPPSPARLGLIP